MNSSYNVHMGNNLGGKGGFWEAYSSYAFMFIRRKKLEEDGGFWDDFFLQLGPTSPIKLLSIEKTVRPSFFERKKIRTMMDEVAQWMKKCHLISFFFHHLSLGFHQKLSFKVHTVECKVIHPIVCIQNSTKISCMDLIFTS